VLIVDKIDTDEGFDSIHGHWDELIAHTPDISIFQTYDFLRIWWEVFGEDKRLHLLTVKKQEDGNVVSILPFFCYRRNIFNILRFLGDDLGDYTHVVSEVDAEILSKTVLKYFRKSRGWDGMMLTGL